MRIVTDQFLGVRVTGQVRNTIGEKIGQLARINILVFDASGRVSGGGYTSTPPCSGRPAAFKGGNGTDVTPWACTKKTIV